MAALSFPVPTLPALLLPLRPRIPFLIRLLLLLCSSAWTIQERDEDFDGRSERALHFDYKRS